MSFQGVMSGEQTTILICVLLKDSNRAPVTRVVPEINSRACLCVLQGPRHNARCWFFIQRFIFFLIFCLETPKRVLVQWTADKNRSLRACQRSHFLSLLHDQGVYWEWGFYVFLLATYENPNVEAFALLCTWVCITQLRMFLTGWAILPVLMVVWELNFFMSSFGKIRVPLTIWRLTATLVAVPHR